MRYLVALIIVLMSVGLTAQVGMNMNTPEGSVNMSVTGMPMGNPHGNAADQSTIDQIVAKLDQLEKEVHTKLTKLDQKRADKIMQEIYDLLAKLQDGAPASNTAATTTASASASSSSSSASSSTGTANININISGMEGQTPPPQNQHHNDNPPPQSHNNPPQTHNNPPQHQEQMGPKPMPDSDFNNLIKQINSESFSDNKMRVIRTAAKNYNFSCGQIVRVIDCFDFSEDKITSLGITYPKVTDPKNNYTILDSFTFSDDKDAAERIMN